MEGNVDIAAGPDLHMDNKNWNIEDLLAFAENFEDAPRVDISTMQDSEIEKLVQDHEERGIPVVLEGWHLRDGWQQALFTPEWLKKPENVSQRITVRDMEDKEDREMTMKSYFEYVATVKGVYVPDGPPRLYAKDGDCPKRWEEWLRANLSAGLLPYDEGDFTSCLPPELRAQTLMTYLGPGDTWTPAHKDLCGSVGQNLMVCAQGGASYWFMASTKDRRDASAYWRKLGHELDHELHAASLQELVNAPFPIYVVKQRLGDLVIVPPSSCHQVHNAGGLTVKIAWSRMSIKSLELSLREELYIYQRVCRKETYRVRTMIDSVLNALVKSCKDSGAQVERLIALERLLPLYQQMLTQSYTVTHKSLPRRSLSDEYCGACGGDLWQSAFTCECRDGTDKKESLVCPPCYLDGRACGCRLMQPVMDKAWPTLVALHDEVVHILTSAETGEIRKHRSISITWSSDKYVPYFRLACFLHASRRALSPSGFDRTRRCGLQDSGTSGKRESHDLLMDEGITCEPCHRNQCFRHILGKFGRHCASVFEYVEDYQEIQGSKVVKLANNMMKSNKWHEIHQELNKKRHISDHDVSFEDDWRDWLPSLASLYQPQASLTPGIIFLGWYDDDLHMREPSPEIVPGSSSKGPIEARVIKREEQEYSQSSTMIRKRKASSEIGRSHAKFRKKEDISSGSEELLMPPSMPSLPSTSQTTMVRPRRARASPALTYESTSEQHSVALRTRGRARVPETPSVLMDETTDMESHVQPPVQASPLPFRSSFISIPRGIPRSNVATRPSLEEQLQDLESQRKQDRQTIKRQQQQIDAQQRQIEEQNNKIEGQQRRIERLSKTVDRVWKEGNDKSFATIEELRTVVKKVDELDHHLRDIVRMTELDLQNVNQRVDSLSSSGTIQVQPPPPPSSYISSGVSEVTREAGSSAHWFNDRR